MKKAIIAVVPVVNDLTRSCISRYYGSLGFLFTQL